LHLKAKGDVVKHRHMGEERIALEHGVDVPVLGGDMGDLVTGQMDGATIG